MRPSIGFTTIDNRLGYRRFAAYRLFLQLERSLAYIIDLDYLPLLFFQSVDNELFVRLHSTLQIGHGDVFTNTMGN